MDNLMSKNARTIEGRRYSSFGTSYILHILEVAEYVKSTILILKHVRLLVINGANFE
jgi:hypothetical protein